MPIEVTMTNDYISEQRRQFTNKNIDKKVLRNPPIKCNAVRYIKPFEDSYLRLAPKPLQEPESVYNNDFIGGLSVPEEKIPIIRNHLAIRHSEKLLIDRSKPSYSKYLDSSATSSRLDYFHFSLDQQRGIGAKDNITYWSWIKDDQNKTFNVWPLKQNLQDKFSKNKNLNRRRGEFEILQNSVPNSGLTTETKSNFKDPDRSLDFNFKCICDQLDGNVMNK